MTESTNFQEMQAKLPWSGFDTRITKLRNKTSECKFNNLPLSKLIPALYAAYTLGLDASSDNKLTSEEYGELLPSDWVTFLETVTDRILLLTECGDL